MLSQGKGVGNGPATKPSVLSGHTRWVNSIGFMPDGTQFLSGSLDGTLRTWDTAQCREICPPINNGTVSSMAVSNDGCWIATGNDRWRIDLWDAITHDKVGVSADAHHGSVECLSFSPGTNTVVSGAGDTTVAVWHVPTGERFSGLFRCHVDAVISVVFSPDGDRFASTDGSDIRIRDVRSGDLVLPFVNLKGRVGCLVWPLALGDELLYASCEDRVVSVNPSTGAVRMQWKAHQLSITHLALSGDGNLIAASSQHAKTVQIWNTTTQQEYAPAFRYDAYILCIAISPDGSRVIAAGEDSKICVWPLPGNPEHGTALSTMAIDAVSEDGNVVDIPNHADKQLPNDITHQLARDSHDPVASGGFADIYQGILRENGQMIRVAIKAIKTYSGEDENLAKKQKVIPSTSLANQCPLPPTDRILQRLRREIKVWLNLEHVNVLRLLGTTTGFGRFPAMVCPWAENGPLTSYLERRYDSLPEADILGLLNNVGCGLHYLHSRSIVHGDLSGSNVLIGENGNAYIADFGLSMLLTELGGSTFATSFHARGTLRWTAPELLDLDVPEDGGLEEESPRAAPTTQSDVYSFGSVMLQILSGKVPYHYYMREAQVVHAVSRGMTPRRPINALVTERRWMFIQRCWSRVDIAGSRPSSEEIVEFSREKFIGPTVTPTTTGAA